MARTVTARFETEEEAERALATVAGEVPLRDSAVVGSGVAGALTLDSLQLAAEDRAACDQQLSKGGFLVVAQVVSEARAEAVLRLLNGMKREGPAAPTPAAAPPAARVLNPPEEVAEDASLSPPVEQPAPVAESSLPPVAPKPAAAAPGTTTQVEEEQRIPIIEEELRIGKREVVRGRSRVHSYVAEVPVQEEVELLHEETHVERRPVNRRLTEEEVVQGGLLQERVVEITEMREEAVVTKEAFVREELVVTKSIHRRVEQIEETVRRTEVETERLQPEESAPSGA